MDISVVVLALTTDQPRRRGEQMDGALLSEMKVGPIRHTVATVAAVATVARCDSLVPNVARLVVVPRRVRP